ncbi:hypothetical protein [Barnesiella intestinihominis]|uniref:hypothetical protein n=1 Tax=Barnesiella intestinihominis TaxID=487174 RepID=UPI003AB26E5D
MKKITSVLFLFYCFSVGWAQTVPPCTLEITDAETFARDWIVIDVNSDVSANTWAYNDGNAMYTQDKSNAADDWLIAPAVTLEAGKAYKVSAYVKHSSTFGSDKQKIELKIGTAPTVEGLTTRLVYDESFQSRLFVEKSGTFSPAENGVFMWDCVVTANRIMAISISRRSLSKRLPFIRHKLQTFPSLRGRGERCRRLFHGHGLRPTIWAVRFRTSWALKYIGGQIWSLLSIRLLWEEKLVG